MFTDQNDIAIGYDDWKLAAPDDPDPIDRCEYCDEELFTWDSAIKFDNSYYCDVECLMIDIDAVWEEVH